MTLLIDPVGAGTITYTTSPVVNKQLETEYPDRYSSIGNGTDYTFTAHDGLGYKFAMFEATVDVVVTDYSTGQVSSTYTAQLQTHDNPFSKPIDGNFWQSSLYPFEGTVRYRWLQTTYPVDYLYTFSNLTITAYFTQRTGRLIRNTAGTLLVRADDGQLLVDA